MATPRLPRFWLMNGRLSLGMNSACSRQGSPSSGSTLTTSAPISDNSDDAMGPAMIWLQSRI